MVELNIGIQVLVDMLNAIFLRDQEPQVVETGGTVGAGDARCRLLEVGGVEEEHRPEVEIVAQAACLVIDDGSLGTLVATHVVMVGIEHAGIGILGDAHQAQHGLIVHAQRVVFIVEKCVVALGSSSNGLHRHG